MHRITHLLVGLALLAACTTPVDLIRPEISIEQISAPNGGTRYFAGPISVTYRLWVANRSEEPLVLRHVELTNFGGPYRFPRFLRTFNVTVAPGRFETIEFSLNAVASSTNLVEQPVTLRGVAYFDSPAGPVRQLFNAEVRYEDPRRRRQ